MIYWPVGINVHTLQHLHQTVLLGRKTCKTLYRPLDKGLFFVKNAAKIPKFTFKEQDRDRPVKMAYFEPKKLKKRKKSTVKKINFFGLTFAFLFTDRCLKISSLSKK